MTLIHPDSDMLTPHPISTMRQLLTQLLQILTTAPVFYFTCYDT